MADIMNQDLKNTLFVAIGGALGTLFRYLINIATFTPAFPVGTAIENITGAFLLGVTTGIVAAMASAPQWLRAGVGVGFCGGYTTMSTFAADSFAVTVHQSPALAAGYVGVSVVFGLLLAWIGLATGRRIGARLRRSP